jgi:hypothetical protein
VTLDRRDGRPRFQHAVIALRRAAAARGEVAEPSGALAAGVRLAAFALSDGVPAQVASAAAVTSESGRFQLNVGRAGDYLVVAFAPAFRPSATVAQLKSGKVLELPLLTLRCGESISGRVARSGGRSCDGACIEARAVACGRLLSVDDTATRLLWTPERLEFGVVTVVAGPDGTYRLEGLTADDYRIVVVGLPSAHCGLLLSAQGDSYHKQVAAPAAGIDFQIGVATLDVLVRQAAETTEGINLLITDAREAMSYGGHFLTGDDGRVRCLVRPNTTLVVETDDDAYELVRDGVRSPAAGRATEVVLDVQRKSLRSTLAVTIAPEEGDTLPAAYRFELTPTGGGPVRRFCVTAGMHRRYVLRGLAPGSYRVVARAGESDLRDEWYCRTVEASVDLVDGVETPLELRPKLGGRLKLLTVAPDGRTCVGAFCWIETASGERLDVVHAKFSDDGAMISKGRLPKCDGPAFVRGVLVPGFYRLYVVPDSYRSVAREFRIKGGETTELRINLEE